MVAKSIAIQRAEDEKIASGSCDGGTVEKSKPSRSQVKKRKERHRGSAISNESLCLDLTHPITPHRTGQCVGSKPPKTKPNRPMTAEDLARQDRIFQRREREKEAERQVQTVLMR